MKVEVPFTNDRYDEEPYGEAEGAEVSRVHISRTCSGGLDGSSTAELLIATSDGGGGYVGQDVVSGTLSGRSGGFLFQHTGLMGPDGVTNTGVIVPGTGTDELEGITGEGTMLADDEGNHTFSLTYELP